MKTNKFFLLAAIAFGTALSFTSCSKDDNPANEKKTAVITFENQTLNDKGFWCGEVNENGIDTGYGTAYPCT